MVINITRENKDEIRLPRTIDNDWVRLDGLTGYRVNAVTFTYDHDDEGEGAGDGMLVLKNCVNCTISNCVFKDKSTKGNFITLLGERSDHNVIDHCEFKNHTFDDRNGGESIRIGNSNFSSCSFNTTVQYCYFHDLRADKEDISIKSCGNVLQNNRHENCESSFTIRHGGSNTIQNNVFIGSGGIRVYGDDNGIKGNVHLNNDNDGDFLPLRIDNGNLEEDPNFDRGCRDGCSHAVYARVKNNTIEGNIYYNCKEACVNWGYKTHDEEEGKCKKDGRIVKTYQLRRSIPPTNNTFEKNTLVVEDGRGELNLVVFTEGGTVAGNTFRANKLYGENAKRGGLPQEAVERLPTRPEIRIPDVWQPVTEEDLIRLDIKGAVLSQVM
jgi:hypothetical protein